MTSWLPDLSQETGPLYVRLANRIERDIGEGALPAGSKLPPQRNLAFDIGVTVGTVGRAYAILRQRGLVNGEVGRGTFILDGEERDRDKTNAALSSLAGTRNVVVPAGMLTMDSTSAPDVGQAALVGKLAAEITREHPHDVTSYTRKIPQSWAEAGSRWLGRGNWTPAIDGIVPALGAHSVLLSVIAALTAPGDRIVFEELTYSSIARSANLIGRRSIGVAMDDDGIEPEDFERTCAQQHPKMAFLMPGLQNPTLTMMPEARRREIVRIARKHNVWLIEDAIYSALLDEEPVTLAELAPELTFHVGGLAKSVAAGVRGGWVACPPHFAPRVLTAYKMLTGGKPFILAEIAARLVLSGAADDIRNDVRREVEARGDMMRVGFEGYDFASHRRAPFLWMKLPEPWLSGTFKNAAANEGVLIDDEDEYKCGQADRMFHRVRIAFSAPAERRQVAAGLTVLRSLLDNRIAGYDSYG